MNIEKEVAAMAEMTVGQLREKYEDVFGETTTSGNKAWMVKRIAWRMQANAYGGSLAMRTSTYRGVIWVEC